MAKKKYQKGKGTYLTYQAENRLQKNRDRKLKNHMKRFPNDQQAFEALQKPKTPRKASRGHTPETETVLRDAAGNKLNWPTFTPRNYKG